MKKHLLFLGVVAIALSACGPVYVVRQPAPPPSPAPAEPPPADADDVSYQTFYDQLSPYGQWIEDPDYGYVWMPDVNSDFKPYATNGYWVYTDEGWTWDSGYPWGWAAFHYGRWFFKDGYGWTWIPGNEWAPAWVSWRNSDDYYGWAPLGPSISLNVAYGGGYNPPSHYWCFVPHQYISSPQVSNYYVRETNNVTIINRTTIINNTSVVNNPMVNHPRNPHYGYGPDPNDVGRYTGSPLHPTPIRESRTPGGQAATGSFAIYRPRVNPAPAANPNSGNNSRRSFAPTHYQTINNVRPVNRTSYGNPGQTGAANSDADNRSNGNDRNNGNDRSSGNDRNNGNNGNRENRPVNTPPVNTPPANTPPANTPRVNTPPVNTPPANNPHANTPPSNTRAGRPTTSGRQPQGRVNTPPSNATQPRPVANGPKPAPPQQRPPHPPGKPDTKPDDKP